MFVYHDRIVSMIDKDLFKDWYDLTSKLPAEVQNVLARTLRQVADSKLRLAYHTDYQTGCNIVDPFTELTHLFGKLNHRLYLEGVNQEPNIVSWLAAQMLLNNFGQINDKELETAVNEAMEKTAFETGIPSTTVVDRTRDWLNSLNVLRRTDSGVS